MALVSKKPTKQHIDNNNEYKEELRKNLGLLDKIEYESLPQKIKVKLTKDMYNLTITSEWSTLSKEYKGFFFNKKENYTAIQTPVKNKYYKQSNNFNEVATLKSLNYY